MTTALPSDEEWTPQDLAEMRADIAAAVQELDGGHGRPWDVEQVKAKLRERAGRSNEQ